MLYTIALSERSAGAPTGDHDSRSVVDERPALLHLSWFRQLTICGAIIAAGFTLLLAGLGVWLDVAVLLVGAALVGAVFVVTLVALALARPGRLLLAAQLLAGAGVAHAIIQSYLFPFAASVLAVSVVLSVASVLPYVEGPPLRWLVVGSILSSLAVATLPHLSPLGAIVPAAAQNAIEVAALPAVTILTSLLLLQFSERVRHARQAEAAAHFETEQTQRALEHASQRLRIALSAVGLGTWDLDLATGGLSLDERCRALLDVREGEALHYGGLLGLVVADDQERFEAAIQSAAAGDAHARHDVDVRVLDANGRAQRWMHFTAQLLFEGAEAVRLIGTAQDVTPAKTSEAELRNAKEQAEETSRAKDEFLAMLGHELRNPLAPMLTALELLRVRMGEAGARERGVIHRQVKNLAQLVDDLLDVAHIRKGRMEIAKQPIYARQIVAEALEMVTPMLEEHRHHLEVDIQPPSLVIVGDGRRLVQAVTNLLTNAVKYTDPGGAVRVVVETEGQQAVVRVSDTGRGIPASLLPRVFDLFVQGERTPDRRDGGLGLGLPIVRSIVERHGGTVSAFSGGAGAGSEFVIQLPASAADTPLPAALAPVPADRLAGFTSKILIIDDNRDLADSLQALLCDHGFSCVAALDGPSGLEAVASFAPDAILLDLGLPGLDGYEVARRIRASADGDRRLLVAVTGYGEERDRQRSAEAGFDAHLVKPVDFDQLLTVLHAMSRVVAADASPEDVPGSLQQATLPAALVGPASTTRIIRAGDRDPDNKVAAVDAAATAPARKTAS
jgi:signal transduction histidine kinase/DNA-binding NarL/FixJ family response regulator